MYLISYIFLSIWSLILWKEAGNKQSNCSDFSKYRAFTFDIQNIIKIRSHIDIFNIVIGKGKWCYDAASHALKCIYELLGNIWFLHSMKSILDTCKNLVDAYQYITCQVWIIVISYIYWYMIEVTWHLYRFCIHM